MPGRTYTREFKLDIVNQINGAHKTTAQLCREHALSPSLIHRWRKEVEARGEAAFTDQAKPDQSLEQRIAELERFCGQLSLENTILKKSLATYRSKNGIK
ncbi:transposase [Deinococcus hopiensis]|uniref:Transposase and inactivated derivatives n=1 Tax=Deinococcus hopiensis KR-140 TaxID=695939 RepID=A0A1W1UNN6_9DEIO|nr:transposase [Deinococcus hopiensis]SMB82697.1 Transposase and inactivated derivatives [Deinococcus hopiensis KR-140]